MTNPLVFLGRVLVGPCTGHHVGLTWKGRLILFDHTIEEARAEASLDMLTGRLGDYRLSIEDARTPSGIITKHTPIPPHVCGTLLTSYDAFKLPPQWRKNGVLKRTHEYHERQRMMPYERRAYDRDQFVAHRHRTPPLYGMSRAIMLMVQDRLIRPISLATWELLRSDP